ncbi:MAG: hypothetical protein A2687_00910 [Candidatus Levybacteria bacterium RIFCSPHIGHO2_01_FULL_38_26]|nr:MAG: hypothetical protein A2687_00910 [Candidatus Levybacteria bacterium RIFCSPHIGHO2_01_FULL_38_26]
MAHERKPFYPEQNNNPLTGRGGLRLSTTTHDRISTTTREASPPPQAEQITPAVEARLGEMFNSITLAPPPTKEEQDYYNNKNYPKKSKTGTVVKVGLATGAGFAALGGTYAIVREISPEFREYIEGRLIPRAESSPVEANEAFDNGAKKTTIGPNNMYYIDSDNMGQFNLESVINKEKQTISFPLPFKMPDNTTGTIERIDLADTDPNAQDPTQRPPVALIDFKFDNIVTTIAPEDSHIYLVRGIQDWGQDPDLAGQVRFYKYYEEENTTVVWWFVDNNPTQIGTFNNLLPMQSFEKEKLRGTNYEKLPAVDALTEVMTAEPNQPIRLAVMAYNGRVVGPEAEVASDDFLLKPYFSTDSSNGTEKLLAFKKE